MSRQTAQVRDALAWLERRGSASVRKTMATRYGIVAPKAYGVPVGAIQALGKRLGRDHDLAAALWDTGWYEARLLCAYVDDPAYVTGTQMDRWARDFDNWGVCDTLCFALFDRSPAAWSKVAPWSRRRAEFVKRGAFALLASLALHDKRAEDEAFLRTFPLIERAASDERNFVKKGVSWALRVIGRRNRILNEAAVALAGELASSPTSAARWIGKDGLRELTGAVVRRQLAARARTSR